MRSREGSVTIPSIALSLTFELFTCELSFPVPSTPHPYTQMAQPSSRVLPPHRVIVREGERDNLTSLLATCGEKMRHVAEPGEIINLRALDERTRVEIIGNDLTVHARGQDARVFVIGTGNKVLRHGMEGEFLHVMLKDTPDAEGKPDRLVSRPEPAVELSRSETAPPAASPPRNGEVYRRVSAMVQRSFRLYPAPSHTGRSMGRLC